MSKSTPEQTEQPAPDYSVETLEEWAESDLPAAYLAARVVELREADD